jgi:NitT/TauT family transport system permease protein
MSNSLDSLAALRTNGLGKAAGGKNAIAAGVRMPAEHEDTVAAMNARAVVGYRRAIRLNRTAVAVGRALLIVFVIGSWGYAAQLWSDTQSISDPASVFAALIDLVKSGRVWPELGQTLSEVFVGYAAGAVAATVLAFAFAMAPAAERVLRPFLLAVYSIPKIALAPLVVMWFGLGIAPKMILSATFVFFIVFMNSIAGIESVKRDHVNILKVMGAGRWALLLKLVLPTMMPFLLLGLRLSIPDAMTGAVIGEFISASRGLGYLVYSASNELNMAVSIAAIVVLVLVVGIADGLLGLLERRLPWQTVMNGMMTRGRM